MRRFGIYLFVLFLGTFPLQTVYLLREPIIGGEKWQCGTIGIYATDLVLVLIFGGYCLEYFLRRLSGYGIEGQRQSFSLLFARKQRASEKAVFAPRLLLKSFLRSTCIPTVVLGTFFVWAGFSIFWAPDPVLAGYFFGKLLLAGGVFWIAHSFKEHEANWAVMMLCIGAISESALGIWQFLSQSAFVSTWLGMSEHEAWQAGISVLKNDVGRWLRAYGTLPHPNMLGGYLGAILVLGAGYFSHRALSVRVRWMVWGGSMTILLGLLVTFSRTAWVGTAMGMLVFVFLSVWLLPVQSPWNFASLKRMGEARIVRVCMVFCMATLVFFWVLRETTFPRFESSVIERERSVSERVQSLEDAREVMSKKNIWLGVGSGNFTVAVTQAQPERPIWSVQPAHNVFALIFVELGVVGIVLFLCFLFSLVWSALREKNSIFLAVFGVLFLSLCLDHWLWSTHFGLLFLFLTLGLSAKKIPL